MREILKTLLETNAQIVFDEPISKTICGVEIRFKEVYLGDNCKVYGKSAQNIVFKKYGVIAANFYILKERSKIKLSQNFIRNVNENLVTRLKKHVVFEFDIILKIEKITYFILGDEEVLRI